MLNRLITVGIVAFWLVMMTLLVRLETHPETTNILDVPVSYVTRLVFKHGQQPRLMLRDHTLPVGDIALLPAITPAGDHTLEFTGAISLQLPLAARQRYNFAGGMDMDRSLEVRDFHVDLSMQRPQYRLGVSGDFLKKTLTYDLYQAGRQTASQSLPMDAAQLGPALMQNMGLDPRALPAMPVSMPSTVVTARESTLAFHGEQLQVYRVTGTVGSEQVFELYVTQVGQIIRLNTNFGYTLTLEDEP